MPGRPLILCECCALKLANDDVSGCRDYHHHTHPGLNVPAESAISAGPHTWDGTLDLACHGHEGGTVSPGDSFWIAEIMSEPDNMVGKAA